MRLLWLPTVLRAAGLTVNEYAGWRTRGSSSFGPVRGIVCHGTAGSRTSTDAGELRVIAITGSNSATAPIAQLYLSRSGEWWVCASGTCTGVRTGWGGPLRGYGDDAVLQIEAQHHPSESWTDTQYQSYVRGVAALAAHQADGYDVPVAHVIGHGEHQPGARSDPWFDMDEFRRDVLAVIEGDSMITNEHLYALIERGDRAQTGDGLGGDTHDGGKWHSQHLRVPQEVGFKVDMVAARVDVLTGVIGQLAEAIRAGGGSVDTTAILAGVDERLAAHRAAVEADTRDAVADGFEGGAAAARAGS